MSAIFASGAKRTSARGGVAALSSRVMGGAGWFVLSDAVWNEEPWFFIKTVPITPACSNSASAAAPADHAMVRGESLPKNSAIRVATRDVTDGLRTGSPSIASNSFCMARTDGAPRLSLR